MNAVIKKALREPLLHFLLLGAGLFLLYSMLQQPGRNGEPGEIIVTAGEVEHLAASFAKTWQRPPTAEELSGLVRDRVREEVYYREAVAMGLDKDDTIIRRRLRQKMEFISDDIASQQAPTEADLSAYLAAHADAFCTEPRFTFTQVYLNPEKRGENITRDATQLLDQLNRSANKNGTSTDPGMMGDVSLLEHQFTGVHKREVVSQFGEPFAQALATLTPGQWQGPIESAYGIHLVLITKHSEGTLPALADIRDKVKREWANAQRLAANDTFYQQLLKRYTVTIEGLEPTVEQKKLAANNVK